MRIVYCCNAGFLEHVSPEVESLANQGFEVMLVIEVTPAAWSRNILDLPLPDLPGGLHDGADLLRRNLPESVWRRLARASTIRLAVFGPGLGVRSVAVGLGIRREVARWQPDVVHSDGDTLRSCLWILPKAVPLVVNVHEPVMPRGSRFPHAALGKHLLIQAADRVIVHSQAAYEVMRTVRRRPARDIAVAPMGVMVDFAEWCDHPASRDADAGPVIALWGQLSERKGLETLVAAAPRVCETVANVRFVVAGGLYPKYELPELPVLPNGGNFDVRIGHVSNSDLCALLSECTVVVAPYTDAMQSSVVLTCFAFGRPIVASDTGGLREQIQDGLTGWLVAPGDPRALADALVGVLNDPEAVARASRAVQERWSYPESWRQFGETSAIVYARLVSS
jgi:glycosyltransferase involved in cell wall biosynthesis